MNLDDLGWILFCLSLPSFSYACLPPPPLSFFFNLLPVLPIFLISFCLLFFFFFESEWIESRSFIFLPCRNTTWQDMKHMLSRFTKSRGRLNALTMLYTRILLWYEWHLRRLISLMSTTSTIKRNQEGCRAELPHVTFGPQRSRIWWIGDVVEQRHCLWLEWNFYSLLNCWSHSAFWIFYSWIIYT